MARPGILVKEIMMGDVEDPYLYAAFPIAKWQETEEYAYLKENVQGEMSFYCDPSPEYMGFMIRIYADLEGPALTYWILSNGAPDRYNP